jgi:hypothetical protein
MNVTGATRSRVSGPYARPVQPAEVLGLPPGASPEACRAAYRRLVRVHHPDAHPDATAAEQAAHAAALRQVVAAYEALLGPAEAGGPGDDAVTGGALDDDLLESLDGEPHDELDDLGPAADRPLSSAGAGRVPAMIAMGLVAASFMSFCVSVVMSQTALWQLSLGLGFAALLAFILLPFFVMLRSHR